MLVENKFRSFVMKSVAVGSLALLASSAALAVSDGAGGPGNGGDGLEFTKPSATTAINPSPSRQTSGIIQISVPPVPSHLALGNEFRVKTCLGDDSGNPVPTTCTLLPEVYSFVPQYGVAGLVHIQLSPGSYVIEYANDYSQPVTLKPGQTVTLTLKPLPLRMPRFFTKAVILKDFTDPAMQAINDLRERYDQYTCEEFASPQPLSPYLGCLQKSQDAVQFAEARPFTRYLRDGSYQSSPQDTISFWPTLQARATVWSLDPSREFDPSVMIHSDETVLVFPGTYSIGMLNTDTGETLTVRGIQVR